ncbi:DUF4253 domain-containing protein [Jatrophihabitans sp. YIM 134969]
MALPAALQPLADRGVRFRHTVVALEPTSDLTVWSVAVRGEAEALDLWSAVREHHPSTGLYPVLVAADTWDGDLGAHGHAPASGDEDEAARWLEAALARGDPRFTGAGAAAFTSGDPSRWREDSPLRLDTPDRLLILPAPGGWDVPGRLGWEGAPLGRVPGDAHAAFLRRWHDRYGADLVMLGGETLSLRVSRPPRTSAAAVEAARELVLYCPDTIDDAGLPPRRRGGDGRLADVVAALGPTSLSRGTPAAG